jgi:multidrug resistance efflux pump
MVDGDAAESLSVVAVLLLSSADICRIGYHLHRDHWNIFYSSVTGKSLKHVTMEKRGFNYQAVLGNPRFLATSLIVLLALGVLVTKYWYYFTNPWTRDGQVRAQVIQITPRVTGPIVKLPISDNQFVKAGDLLFQIDPRTFEADLSLARAELDNTGYDIVALAKQVEASKAAVEAYMSSIEQAALKVKEAASTLAYAKSQYERAQKLVPKGAMSKKQLEGTKASYEVDLAKLQETRANLLQEEATLKQTKADLAKAEANLGAPGDLNAQIRSKKAQLREAELNLEFTEVRAPVDGYVTNLNLRLGSQAVADQAALALVDMNSFWIHGFFRENYIGPIRPGDRAIVTLMTYPDTPLEGRVESLGWGIAQQDGGIGQKLLPEISPTFEWIRLAQRIPVRVHLIEVPEEIELRVGMTASVMVVTGSSGDQKEVPVVAAPRALQ